MYKVPILAIERAFQRAHRHVVSRYGNNEIIRLGKVCGKGIHHVMIDLWISILEVTPVIENSRWAYLEFNSEKSYLMFILKWG